MTIQRIDRVGVVDATVVGPRIRDVELVGEMAMDQDSYRL